MTHTLKTALQHAINELYTVFAAYPLRAHIDGCPCCVHEDDQRRLRAAPLHLLTGADLEQYAFQALTTWGDTDDLRHFLPRLFELQATNQLGMVDSEILYGKLNYGQWQTWPQHEQDALQHYFMALWADVLASPEHSMWANPDTYLCAIGQAVDDLAPFLMYWTSVQSHNAWTQLHEYIVENWDRLVRNKLGNAFWKGREQQQDQVVRWLYNPATVNDLEAIFFAEKATIDPLALVIDALHQLHALRR